MFDGCSARCDWHSEIACSRSPAFRYSFASETKNRRGFSSYRFFSSSIRSEEATLSEGRWQMADNSEYQTSDGYQLIVVKRQLPVALSNSKDSRSLSQVICKVYATPSARQSEVPESLDFSPCVPVILRALSNRCTLPNSAREYRTCCNRCGITQNGSGSSSLSPSWAASCCSRPPASPAARRSRRRPPLGR